MVKANLEMEDRVPFVSLAELDDEERHHGQEENGVVESIELTIDEVLNRIGFGRYHFILIVVLLFFGVFHSYPTLIMVFGDDDPPWQCKEVRPTNLTNSSSVALRNSTCTLQGVIRFGNKEFHSRCAMDRQDWMFTTSNRYSMLTELDLVCDKAPWNAAGKAILFIFWGIGCLFLGHLGDTFGRKPVFFISFVMMMICGTLIAFIASLWQFLVLRAILGLSISQFGLMFFVIPVESVAPRHRALICSIGGVFFTGGLLLMDLQSYFVPDWRELQLITTVPYIVLLASWSFVPESPRWLLTAGKFERTYKLLTKITGINHKRIGTYTLFSTSSATAKKPPWSDLFCNSILRKRTLLQCLVWFVVAMTYYGLSLASSDLGGSMHANFALVSVFEVPASFVAVYCLNRFGRRRCVVIGIAASGAACILVAVVPLTHGNDAYHILRVAFGMAGKFFSAFAFTGIYIWCAELYPTTIRSRALGVIIFTSRMGASSAPFVVDILRTIGASLAFVFMGSCCLGAAMVSSCLPETNLRPTLETMDDLMAGEMSSPRNLTVLSQSIATADLSDFESDAEVENSGVMGKEDEQGLLR